MPPAPPSRPRPTPIAGTSDRFELRYRTVGLDGATRQHLAVGQIERDEAGQAVRVVGLVRDITEEREAERLREELTAIATHELKTPLTSIRGALSLMESDAFSDGLSEPVRQMVAMASRNEERLVDLANALLDVERMASHGSALHEADVEVGHLRRRAAESMSGLARSRDIGSSGTRGAPGGRPSIRA